MVRRVLKLFARPTMLSVSSSTYTDFSWFTEDGAIGESVGSSATISIRISYWYLLKFSSLWRMVSLDKSSSLIGYRHFITHFGPHLLVSSLTPWNKMSTINTSTSTPKSTKLVRKASISTSKYSGDGSHSQSGTEQSATLAQSM